MKLLRNRKLFVAIPLALLVAEAMRLIVHGGFSLSVLGGAVLERLPEMFLVLLLIYFLSPDLRRLPDAKEK